MLMLTKTVIVMVIFGAMLHTGSPKEEDPIADDSTIATPPLPTESASSEEETTEPSTADEEKETTTVAEPESSDECESVKVFGAGHCRKGEEGCALRCEKWESKGKNKGTLTSAECIAEEDGMEKCYCYFNTCEDWEIRY